MALQDSIAGYISGFDFSFSRQIRTEVSGVCIQISVAEYRREHTHRQKADVVLSKGGMQYECECIEEHNWDELFYPVTLSGQNFLCFRKTLYGFTLLDAETLTEVYDYFPEKVQHGEESFIVCDAYTFGDFLIFHGCYWACPCEVFVFDYKNQLSANVSMYVGMWSVDSCKIENNRLVLDGTDEDDIPLHFSLSLDDILQCFNDVASNEF